VRRRRFAGKANGSVPARGSVTFSFKVTNLLGDLGKVALDSAVCAVNTTA
jgi:hypothetical protein